MRGHNFHGPETDDLREVDGYLVPDGRRSDELTKDERVRFGKAVLIIAAAGGQLSDSELHHFMGMAKAYGRLGSEELEQLEHFDPHSASLEDCLTADHKELSRAFVYDVIKTSRAEGYNARERQAVRKAAKLLGVDISIVAAIEGLVETEAALRDTRLALLHPWKDA